MQKFRFFGANRPGYKSSLLLGVVGAVVMALLTGCSPSKETVSKEREPLVLIVMDPLAAELACACVEGYAQRDYGKVAALFENRLRREVVIEFSDDLAGTMGKLARDPDVVVIGEESVVKAGAESASLKVRPVARLTGQDGSTTLTGLFVARASDAASGLKDLSGRRLLFGRANAEEKHGAAIAALRAAGIKPPEIIETRATCSDAVLDILDGDPARAPVAVISSYALALLEGCGSIEKGDLKVIGTTPPVRFITAFVSESMAPEKKEQIQELLFSMGSDAALLKALETKTGFVSVDADDGLGSSGGVASDWPDWRGWGRDGVVPWLPDRLPSNPGFVWESEAVAGGLSGLCVAQGRVIVAERDPENENDVVRCLDADSGKLLWRAQFPATGQLDYGESPRATPVARNGRVFILGAFGDLHCLNLESGKLIWQRHLVKDFNAELPSWGTCATPLLVEDKLIVNPGAADAALAALDPATGKILWKSPGQAAAYASFIYVNLGGRRQIVGYDERSLGGWDLASGKRLWRLVPPMEGDFNVPTPVAVNGTLIVATENNGTRMHGFDADGKIVAEPLGRDPDLSPETATPVAVSEKIIGTDHGVYCLDARQNLKRLWKLEDESIGEHASLFTDGQKVLILSLTGELILLQADSTRGEILSRLRVFQEEVEIYSHPALVGTRLYLRGGSRLRCLELKREGVEAAIHANASGREISHPTANP